MKLWYLSFVAFKVYFRMIYSTKWFIRSLPAFLPLPWFLSVSWQYLEHWHNVATADYAYQLHPVSPKYSPNPVVVSRTRQATGFTHPLWVLGLWGLPQPLGAHQPQPESDGEPPPWPQRELGGGCDLSKNCSNKNPSLLPLASPLVDCFWHSSSPTSQSHLNSNAVQLGPIR